MPGSRVCSDCVIKANSKLGISLHGQLTGSLFSPKNLVYARREFRPKLAILISLDNLAAAENTAAAKGSCHLQQLWRRRNWLRTYELSYNHTGLAIMVSNGESGYGTQFPATSPHVTAVGGTHLVKSSTRRGWTETVWSGAGSGGSVFYAKPT